jgi:hypothetical protein
MNDVLLNSVIEKVNAQETTIKEMQDVMQKVAGQPDEIEILQKEVVRLGTILKDVSFPTKEMSNLSEKMTGLYTQLKQPVQTKVENNHHHHFPKVIWFTITLVIGLGVVSAGWYTTASDTDQYKANDTKYRYLKLYGNKSLLQSLNITDSVYQVDPKMRNSVIQKEEENQRIFELNQKASNMKKEAEELRKKSKGR